MTSQGIIVDSQDQCPLFKLPAELRLHIYALCLTANAPITDPSHPTSDVPRSGEPGEELTHLAANVPQTSTTVNYLPDLKHIPTLGTALLMTCRAIYDEVDVRPLYSLNEFSFTDPYIISTFLTGLPTEYERCVTALTLDCRATVDGHDRTGMYSYTGSKRMDDWTIYLCGSISGAHTDATVARPHLHKSLFVKMLIIDLRAAQQRIGPEIRGRYTGSWLAYDVIRGWYTALCHGIIGHPEPHLRVRLRMFNRLERETEVEVPVPKPIDGFKETVMETGKRMHRLLLHISEQQDFGQKYVARKLGQLELDFDHIPWFRASEDVFVSLFLAHMVSLASVDV